MTCFSSIVYPLSVVWSILSWTEALGSWYLSYPNFPTVWCNSSLNSLMLWNNAQRWIQRTQGALLFFEVIHHISRSYGLKNQWFESSLNKITRLVTAIKSLRFALCISCKTIKQNQLENHLVLLCHFCKSPFLLVKHTVTWITWNWYSYCCWFHCEDTEHGGTTGGRNCQLRPLSKWHRFACAVSGGQFRGFQAT